MTEEQEEVLDNLVDSIQFQVDQAARDLVDLGVSPADADTAVQMALRNS